MFALQNSLSGCFVQHDTRRLTDSSQSWSGQRRPLALPFNPRISVVASLKSHHLYHKSSRITMATPATAPEPGQAPRPGPIPSFSTLKISQSLSRFDLPAREFLSRLRSQFSSDSTLPALDRVAVGALVFKTGLHGGDGDGAQPVRVLLIQRAKNDSLPEKWEIPSGVVSNDPEKDATITQAVARELWEETGLMAKRLARLAVGPDGQDGFVFNNSTKTKVFCRYVFEVEVDDMHEVRLNPWEHQDYVWASADEIIKLRVEGGDGKEERLLELTSDHLGNLILEALRMKREVSGE